MRLNKIIPILITVLVLPLILVNGASAEVNPSWAELPGNGYRYLRNVELGPRPYYLIEDLKAEKAALYTVESTGLDLKTTLQSCNVRGQKSEFSIGHRGAPLQFPEHTKESYEAAARMGAGILECDVTFTQDLELVCRHAQCDLHTTTDILARPELAAKCSQPFSPAEFDENGNRTESASARCCASDITLAEFKTLCGKMDAANRNATTVEEYLDGTANWRTDLYSTCGTVLSHAESIELFKALRTGMTPELKSPQVPMPFMGTYTQEDYAQQLIDEYKAAGVPPEDVWAQSFNWGDVVYWINNEPAFGEQAVALDGRNLDNNDPTTWDPSMQEIVDLGINIIAPPTWVLVTVDESDKVVPSAYAQAATDAGLEIITWTLERSEPLAGNPGFYYQSILDVVDHDGDTMILLHVLAQDVGVTNIFTDWPATVTYYANCVGLD